MNAPACGSCERESATHHVLGSTPIPLTPAPVCRDCGEWFLMRLLGRYSGTPWRLQEVAS